MKKRFFSTIFLALLCVFFSSCNSKTVNETVNETVKLELQDGVYVNQKAGYSLIEAPENYHVGDIYADEENLDENSDGAVAIIHSAMGETPLYEIPNMDKKLWLADQDGNLYYDSNTHLPTLGEMTIVKASVCQDSETPQVFVSVEEESKITSLVNQLLTATGKERKFYDGNISARFVLVFTADNGLLYSVEYWRLAEDNGVIYNRTEGLCYEMGSLVEDIFGNE